MGEKASTLHRCNDTYLEVPGDLDRELYTGLWRGPKHCPTRLSRPLDFELVAAGTRRGRRQPGPQNLAVEQRGHCRRRRDRHLWPQTEALCRPGSIEVALARGELFVICVPVNRGSNRNRVRD